MAKRQARGKRHILLKSEATPQALLGTKYGEINAQRDTG